MNAIVMIFGVIGASTLIFAGRSLEHLIAPLRSAVVLALLALFIRAAVRVPNDITGWFDHLFAGSWIVIVMLVSLSILLSIGLRKLSVPILPYIVEPACWALAVLAAIAALRISMPNAIAASVMGVAAFGGILWFIRSTGRYRIWTTAVLGGTGVAYLFTRFYYLPPWLFVLLSILLSAIGILSQSHGWKRSLKQPDGTQKEETRA